MTSVPDYYIIAVIFMGELLQMKPKLLNLTQSAMFAVIIAVCSMLSIPSTVPFTLQTFAVFFSLFMLKGKYGTLSIAVYILLGAVGLPVFHNFTGGIGILLSNTGGYIFGFLLSGLIYIIITSFSESNKIKLLSAFIGLIFCYAAGTLWFVISTKTSESLIIVISACVLPFIVPDIIKILSAYFLSQKLRQVIRKDEL